MPINTADLLVFLTAALMLNLTPGNDMMRMIRRGGFAGAVHAINPNSREIEGYPCVASLADLPAPPDLAGQVCRWSRGTART